MFAKAASAFLFSVALVLWPSSIMARQPLCHGQQLDVVQVQAITSSSELYWRQMSAHASSVMKWLAEVSSDTYFGTATFGDSSPVAGTPGSKSGHCLHVDIPLGPPNATEVVELFEGYRQRAKAGIHGDNTNGLVEGIYRAIHSARLQWRPRQWHGKRIHRIIVALAHERAFLGYSADYTDRNRSEIQRPSAENRHNHECVDVQTQTRIQTRYQLNKLLNEQDVALLIMVAPGVGYDENSTASEREKYGDPTNGLLNWYISKFSGIDNGFLLPLGEGARAWAPWYAVTYGQLHCSE